MFANLKYGQAIFIMSENKDMDIFGMQLKKESQRMDGLIRWISIYIWFNLYRSLFIRVSLHLVFTLLYALPYIMLSSHNYYLHLKQVKGMNHAPINAELSS